MRRIAIVLLAALLAAIGVVAWARGDKDGCDAGSRPVAPITDGATGKVIGVICEHKQVEKPQ